jgi:hypothetical protein
LGRNGHCDESKHHQCHDNGTKLVPTHEHAAPLGIPGSSSGRKFAAGDAVTYFPLCMSPAIV